MFNLSQVVLDSVNVTVFDGGGEDGDGQGSEDEESRAEIDHVLLEIEKEVRRCAMLLQLAFIFTNVVVQTSHNQLLHDSDILSARRRDKLLWSDTVNLLL